LRERAEVYRQRGRKEKLQMGGVSEKLNPKRDIF
jgi:hypothetical protein